MIIRPRPHAAIGLSIVILTCAASAPAGLGDVEFPDTPAGRAARAFVEAFNSADAEVIAEFMRRHRSPAQLAERTAEQRAGQLVGAASTLGALTVKEILEARDHFIAFRTESSAAPMALRCALTLDEAPPHFVTNIELRPLPQGGGDSWAKQEWGSLQELLTRACQATGAPAIAAVVMVDGRVVDEAAAGVRLAGTDDRITLDDRFHIGSITKSMTATMIARLIERGVLQWDDTIGHLLPDVEMHEQYRGVTLEQLLQHRAGLPPGTSGNEAVYEGDDDENASPSERRARFVARALKSEPVGPAGADSAYSNVGYAVAAAIAERAAGRSWADLIRSEVFEPFAMASGGFGWPRSTDHPDQPSGHMRGGAGGALVAAPADYVLGPDIAPAGDIHCTPRDLAAFGWNHLWGMKGNDGPVRAEPFRRLHTPLLPPEDNGYAAGWVIARRDGIGAVHWHNGSAGTFFAQLELHPEHNRVIVVMMNVGLEGQVIADAIIAAIAAKSP